MQALHKSQGIPSPGLPSQFTLLKNQAVLEHRQQGQQLEMTTKYRFPSSVHHHGRNHLAGLLHIAGIEPPLEQIAFDHPPQHPSQKSDRFSGT